MKMYEPFNEQIDDDSHFMDVIYHILTGAGVLIAAYSLIMISWALSL